MQISQRYTMLSVLTLALTAFGTLSASALAQGQQEALRVSIGMGMRYAPSYLGDDDYQVSLFPNLSVSYGDGFSASFRGIRYTLISTDRWQIGPVLSYDFGREERSDESPFAISGGSTTDLVGLGDIDGTIKLGGFAEYEIRPFTVKLELHQGIDGGYNGLSGEASISYRGQFADFFKPVFYSVGPALAYANAAYNSAFFDVSAMQSAASGVSQFDADGGVNSLGLHSSVVMQLTKKTSLVGLLKYDQLTGDLRRSSLVSERGTKDQLTTGIFLNYQW